MLRTKLYKRVYCHIEDMDLFCNIRYLSHYTYIPITRGRPNTSM